MGPDSRWSGRRGHRAEELIWLVEMIDAVGSSMGAEAVPVARHAIRDRNLLVHVGRAMDARRGGSPRMGTDVSRHHPVSSAYLLPALASQPADPRTAGRFGTPQERGHATRLNLDAAGGDGQRKEHGRG